MNSRSYICFIPGTRDIRTLWLAAMLLAAVIFSASLEAALSDDSQVETSSAVSQSEFIELLQNSDPLITQRFLLKLEKNWSPALIPMVLETIHYSSSVVVRSSLSDALRKNTGQKLEDPGEWYQWLWNQAEHLSPDYGEFKASLYGLIDSRFEHYFRGRQASAQIRLDEISWGGVQQDGIPPLHKPKMVTALEADYLGNDNIVFGVEIDGDARAYPKRILAWHEMFTDTFGDGDAQQSIAGVYCTLCGTVIIYKTQIKGVEHQLGTSGFLYRSNKLMYDKATQSLWSTVRGEPVLGPLAGQNIALEQLSVVTTTWQEWRRRHPETTVLSLDTGYRRDYGEGVAYKKYFATDRLMFKTPFQDKRLKNKQEILALRFFAAPGQQLAIDTGYLNKNPVFHNQIGQQKFVVLTDKTGANRVYDPGHIIFTQYDGLDTATDSSGKQWRISEQSLVSKDGQVLNRLPYHRAFWFGWHAAYPETRLIK